MRADERHVCGNPFVGSRNFLQLTVGGFRIAARQARECQRGFLARILRRGFGGFGKVFFGFFDIAVLQIHLTGY